MSGSDRMDSSTQVHYVRCACGHVLPRQPLNVAASKGPSSSTIPGTGRPSGMNIGGLGACRAGSQGGSIVGRQVVKSCLSTDTMMGERTSIDH
jgi:hypothetical protein